MIYTATNPVIQQLNDYFENGNNPASLTGDIAIFGNIAQIEGDTENPEENADKIIISLVNVDREDVLRNGRTYSEVNGITTKHNPIIYLNLFLLFSANFNSYPNGLTYLSSVITFFQGKNIFDQQNTVGLPNMVEKLIFDMHSINLEYLNHLWGVLGGKYYPSVLYKVRLVPIKAQQEDASSIVRAIGTSENSI